MTFPKHKHIKMSQESINQPSSDLMAQTPPSLDKILAMSTPSPPASASAKEVLEQDVEMDIPQNSQVETPANEEHQSTIISEEQADNQLDKLPGAGQVRGPPAVRGKGQATDGFSQSSIDRITNFKIPKVKKDVEESISPSQAIRKMKVSKAFERYQRFKIIHENSLKAFKEFQEEGKKDNDVEDFEGELEWMMDALSVSNLALKKREAQLNAAITDGHDEIEIMPFTRPMAQIARPPGEGTSGGGVKRYLDLEAGVSEKEIQEEGCGGGRKRRKREYKSEEFVVDDGDFDIPLGDEDTTDDAEESSDEEEIRGPDATQQVSEVVMAEDVIKKGKEPAKKKEQTPEPAIEPLPIDKSSIFHNSDVILDTAQLINSPTDEESAFLKKAASALTSNQFDWGEALKDSVIGVISSWEYHENSQLGQPTPEAIQPLVVLMKRTVEGKDIKKNIETCPRLIQIATTDPYLTQDSINWSLISESTRYPWKERNRVFRAFHSMACRTDKSLTWTSEKDIKNKIKTAHKTLHKVLEESVEIISYNTKSDQIEIQTEGEHKVHSSVVPMSQSIAWAWQQCMVKAQEEKEHKSNKVHHQGMSWLQLRFLLIVSGVMLVYERDVYNRALAKFMKTPRSPEEVTNRRNELKGTILNQLSLDLVKKNPQKALPSSRKNEKSNDSVVKVSDQELQTAANEETYEFRRLALQTLALFMMFGTSGLFHVWVWKKEQKMSDAASLIHLSSVLANRRKENSKSEPHVFYQRSWSRLDHHVFTILREFIDDDGGFKKKVNWPTLTQMFHDRFSPTTLSYLYSLDLFLEIHSPLSTRAPDGSIAPDFDFNQRKRGPGMIPITETFKSVWPSTGGKPVPVTDPKDMYLEADGSRVTKNHPLKSITQAKDNIRTEAEGGVGGNTSAEADK
ncbi:hypothetical protein DFH28DRAFT_1228706 [Melampsora americana]|nr:hypothetical protein DFH28DRAFT_1228706 [Melampsora americana]